MTKKLSEMSFTEEEEKKFKGLLCNNGYLNADLKANMTKINRNLGRIATILQMKCGITEKQMQDFWENNKPKEEE
jgi:hypothetical protein